MPKYTRNVSIPGRSSEELFLKLSHDIDDFLKKIFLGKINIDKNQEEKKIYVKSHLLTAELACEEGLVVVNANLSLFAAPFRSKLDAGIDKWLARTFAGDPNIQGGTA
ncbi:MAG: hypothetical protein HY843_07275 [Bdellovibrio sp.]|nr:hypothetical protein [Bdellovibrio sp.]